MSTPQLRLSLLSLSLLAGFAHAETAESTAEFGTVYVTAERQLQQSLGVSKISAQDLEKQPVVNDISDLVRTMPGVNLTDNTATGQRGNKRQIDLRGMGPENTLILIDGRPATSRNSERISMRGERNTRGDSNWVPAEAIDSIEVIRGPAAARHAADIALTADDLTALIDAVGQGRFHELPAPHAVHRDMFMPPPPPATPRLENGCWRGTSTDPRTGRPVTVRIPGAFCDWTPDSTQPPWTDVTYLRLYDHPDFNFFSFQSRIAFSVDRRDLIHVCLHDRRDHRAIFHGH